MGKSNLLSVELSHGRAMLSGGASAQQVLGLLRKWALESPEIGSKRARPALLRWNRSVCGTLEEAIPLGAPVAQMLRSVQPMVRREEKHWARFQAFERQFAFQGAIAIVIPWAVAGLSSGLEMNAFTILGCASQFLGLCAFYLIVRHCGRSLGNERAWAFELVSSAWMRVLSGQSLRSGLESALRDCPSEYAKAWENWLSAKASVAAQDAIFQWREPQSGRSMELSASLASILEGPLRNGAPAALLLGDLIEQLDDQRQSEFEERVTELPVRLSLAFCLFFAPAVFLILFGSLWPMIQDLWI